MADLDFVPPPAEFIADVTRAQRSLHAFIITLVRNAADADDVLQETNLVLWKKAAEFDRARPFMPWAMRIAQLQSLAYLKKKQPTRPLFDPELLSLIANEEVDEWMQEEVRRGALAKCLEKLPREQRSLIARRYEPGSSVNAMSRERGTTPKALSEMLRRIRRSLLLCIERSLTRELAL